MSEETRTTRAAAVQAIGKHLPETITPSRWALAGDIVDAITVHVIETLRETSAPLAAETDSGEGEQPDDGEEYYALLHAAAVMRETNANEEYLRTLNRMISDRAAPTADSEPEPADAEASGEPGPLDRAVASADDRLMLRCVRAVMAGYTREERIPDPEKPQQSVRAGDIADWIDTALGAAPAARRDEASGEVERWAAALESLETRLGDRIAKLLRRLGRENEHLQADLRRQQEAGSEPGAGLLRRAWMAGFAEGVDGNPTPELAAKHYASLHGKEAGSERVREAAQAVRGAWNDWREASGTMDTIRRRMLDLDAALADTEPAGEVEP